jgi:hypothetical protein
MKAIPQYCFYSEQQGNYVISEVPPDNTYKRIQRVSCYVIADMSSTDIVHYDFKPQVNQILNDYEGRKIKIIEAKGVVLRPANQ